MLFSTSVQPSIISLFSSTGSDPLTLFRTSVDKSLPSDSFLHFLHDQYSSPPPPPPGSLLHLPKISEQQDNSPSHGYELDQTVLHIQSPTIQTTYIQCPKAESRDDKSNVLGVKHPWMHLQVRNLGREWAFEVGIVDHAGRVGIVRLSTFQVNEPFFLFPYPNHPSFHLQRPCICGHTSYRCAMKSYLAWLLFVLAWFLSFASFWLWMSLASLDDHCQTCPAIKRVRSDGLESSERVHSAKNPQNQAQRFSIVFDALRRY